MAEATFPKTRMRLSKAIGALADVVGERKLRQLVADGEFTAIRDGAGRGVVIFLRCDEVKAYEEGGLPALRALRAKKGRKGGAK